ncbi:hypothetical protein PO070_17385 [Bacteroides stercoris]|jgi:hypothetical protein|uniref:DUF6808 domain-containing protein n=1 Tax=Bacteroides stercoris TaxID=46506 RepID=UPI00232B8225|nr:hypothetical protein [Bacteroides stercoris]MDC2284214.1 hypothetical protein [Bacteroides stercoris]MDC2297942.1 hypothetical protein [Bacteroides stercoris]
MKKLPWLLVVLLAIACVAAWFRPHEPLPAEIRTETRIQTVVKLDTVLISAPIAVFLTFTNDTIHIGDTVVMREQAYYEDSLYRAWVSGYRPKLDSIEVYPKTIYQTVTNDIYHAVKPKMKRWGLGLQAGYGYPGGLYVGVGISYNLFVW